MIKYLNGLEINTGNSTRFIKILTSLELIVHKNILNVDAGTLSVSDV
jgi:hypothetical protein